MKTEIIKTKEGYITVSNEEIKLGDHFYDKSNNYLGWYGNDYVLNKDCKKLIATHFKHLYNDKQYGRIPIIREGIDLTFKCNRRGILRDGESCRFNDNCDYPNCRVTTWQEVLDEFAQFGKGKLGDWLIENFENPIRK